MSINVADNFSYQGSKPLDARFQFATVAAMKAYAEASLYNGCFAYITGTKEYYTYDSSNTVDSTTGRWRIFESGGGGASALSDLTDTTISNPTSGDVLKYNGTSWVNGDTHIVAEQLTNPYDVFTDTVIGWGEERIFTYGKTDSYAPQGHDALSLPLIPVSSAPFHLYNYSCLIISACSVPSSTDFFNVSLKAFVYYQNKYRAFSRVGTKRTSSDSITWSTEDWVELESGGASALSDLTDTTISSPTSGQVLKYNGSKWVNGSDAGGAEIDDTTTSASKVWSSNKTNTEIGKAYRDTDTAETALDDADYVPFYDTSATTKRKSLWSNIKSVLKTYFDPYYKLVAGTNIGLTDDTNNRIISATNTISLNYSTSEQAIGTWIDSKTLYQRTYSGTTSSTDGGTATLGSLPSSAKVKNIFGYVDLGASVIAPIPYTQENNAQCLCYTNGTSVMVLGKNPSYMGKSVVVTVQYTKS